MIQAEPQTKWPTVIGIIAIVFGVIGALFGFCGIFGALMPGAFQAFQPQEAMEVTQKWAIWSGVNSLVSAAVAVLLLIAGIRLMKRHPGAPGLCRTWAVIKMVVALAVITIGWFVQQDMMASMSQARNIAQPMPDEMMRVMMFVGLVFSLLWAWALPVFMLIWFSRPKIKSEVTTWGSPRAFPAVEPDA
jgi:hypothetical protein